MAEETMVTLTSSEGESFDLPADAASEISELVKDTINCNDEENEVTLPRVSTECLRRIVEFMKHNHEEKMMEIPTPLNGSTFNEVRFDSVGDEDFLLHKRIRADPDETYQVVQSHVFSYYNSRS